MVRLFDNFFPHLFISPDEWFPLHVFTLTGVSSELEASWGLHLTSWDKTSAIIAGWHLFRILYRSAINSWCRWIHLNQTSDAMSCRADTFPHPESIDVFHFAGARETFICVTVCIVRSPRSSSLSSSSTWITSQLWLGREGNSFATLLAGIFSCAPGYLSLSSSLSGIHSDTSERDEKDQLWPLVDRREEREREPSVTKVQRKRKGSPEATSAFSSN